MIHQPTKRETYEKRGKIPGNQHARNRVAGCDEEPSDFGTPNGHTSDDHRRGEDEVSERVDKFVEFPPRYVEPRHPITIFTAHWFARGRCMWPGR